MNKIREKGTVRIQESPQSGMSRCLLGDWPRRVVLKLALPVKEWPLSLETCKDSIKH